MVGVKGGREAKSREGSIEEGREGGKEQGGRSEWREKEGEMKCGDEG